MCLYPLFHIIWSELKLILLLGHVRAQIPQLGKGAKVPGVGDRGVVHPSPTNHYCWHTRQGKPASADHQRSVVKIYGLRLR